jgi:abhydrolase domain-containing protein 12
MHNKWANGDALVDIVRNDSRHHGHIFRAQDDPIVPWTLSNGLFQRAVRAPGHLQLRKEDFEHEKKRKTIQLGEGGWRVEWQSSRGLVRQEVPRYSGHNKIGLHPSITLVVMRAVQSRESSFQG